MNNGALRRKIAALEKVTIAHGAEPGEAVSAMEMAQKLRTKLQPIPKVSGSGRRPGPYPFGAHPDLMPFQWMFDIFRGTMQCPSMNTNALNAGSGNVGKKSQNDPWARVLNATSRSSG